MKNSLLEMMLKHPVGAEHNKEINIIYSESRKKWTEEHGSCLDSEDYLAHWTKREEYIKQMMCLYYQKNGYCQGCKDEVVENEN